MPLKTLLFFSSSPGDQNRLRLDIEEREVKAELKHARFGAEFLLDAQPAVRFSDLISILREKKPYIVHFSGHGEGQYGLILENDQGKATWLRNDILEQIFAQLKEYTHCALLNACYSEVQAQLIAKYVPYVIAMNTAVPDTVAVEFAKQFYGGLGAGETVESAFVWAKVALLALDQTGAKIPVLYKNGEPLESATTKPLAPKQRRFVDGIFNDYVDMASPVLVFARAGFQTQHYIGALKEKAVHRFRAENVLHVFPPASGQVSETDYFAYLARQCGFDAGIQNSTQWGLAMSERLMGGQELFLLITGFENGADGFRRSFAGEVRNLLEQFPSDLHLVMFGGERLAAMKFEHGAMSLLNFIDYVELPELCIEDVRDLYQVGGLSDEALREILEFVGQHPRLVQLCLRDAVNGVDWKEAVRCSSVPSSLFSQVRGFDDGCGCLQRNEFRYEVWAADVSARCLYWQNLLKPENGRLVWRCAWLREVGLELLGC